MLNVYKYPGKEQWRELATRATSAISGVDEIVSKILQDVRIKGDEAVINYTSKIDKVDLGKFGLYVDIDAVSNLETQIPHDLKEAIHVAAENIHKFHLSQLHPTTKIETTKGVTCWQKTSAIEKIGLYIPGGTAPLFSTLLMLAIPAKIAGCKEIVICTPANKEGNINPFILYAAKVVGVKRIYKIGGAQAIAAMAYGTATVPKVYKIFGPGNQYVTKAKQMVSLEDVAIDMPAGPSEVLVMSDDTAKADFIAADLLSQCEHGKDSQCILLTTSPELLDKVQASISQQVKERKRQELLASSLLYSRFILLKSEEEMIEFSNAYAPEHLIIQTKDYLHTASQITNAGSVFLGNYSPESAGDYASGTNHTLPTNGFANNYSGVNMDAFVKKITFQEITKEGLQNLGTTIETMAQYEQLDAHQYAVEVRLKDK